MTLPTILNAEKGAQGELRLSLHVPHDMQAFAGHFPGEPILPGVIQIDWAVQFAVQYLNFSAPVARQFKVKFSNIIRPEMPLSLTLTYNAASGRLSFTYSSDTKMMSSGQITGHATL